MKPEYDIEILSINTESGWINGEVDGGRYRFSDKVFDNPSMYGIKEGRTSKLWIGDYEGDWIANYDRGWDIKPDSFEDNYLLDTIVEFLEVFPTWEEIEDVG